MKNEIQDSKLEDNIIEYYLLLNRKIKMKNLNLTKNNFKKSHDLQDEKNNIKNSNKITKIFDYIIESVDIYADLKADMMLQNYIENRKSQMINQANSLESQQESYESLIRKLESDLRNHMKTEFEMKLHIENLESKFEYYNQIKKENKHLNEKIKKLLDTKKENEILILKAENKNLKEIINKKETQFEQFEKDYHEKILEMNKKILNYEEILKYQNSKNLLESDNDKSTYKSTYSIHKRSNSYLTNNNEKSHSPTILRNNNGNNTLRVLSSSNSNFNSNKADIIKNIEFNKIDNLKSKLVGVPSSGNLFDSNLKKSVNKILYKNISRKITSERSAKQNTSNDSIQIKNEFMKKNSNSNININDYVMNSISKSKIVAKISKGAISNQNYKN